MNKTLRGYAILTAVLLSGAAACSWAGKMFDPVTFYRDVDFGIFVSNSANAIAFSSNAAGTVWIKATTNAVYYRINGTNDSGRLPVSAVRTASWVNVTGSSNTITISWARHPGVNRYVLEMSRDGANWTNWISQAYGDTNYVDYGSNSWTETLFTNLYPVIPAPTIDFGSGTVVNAVQDGDTLLIGLQGPVGRTSTNALITRQDLDNVVGQQVTMYFRASTTSDIPTYYQMTEVPSESNEITRAFAGVTNDQYLIAFSSPTGGMRLTAMAAGIYGVHVHANKGAAGAANFKAEAYLRNAGGSEYFEIDDTPYQALTTAKIGYDFDIILATNIALAMTDRWIIKFKAEVTSGAPTINIYTEGASRGWVQGNVGSAGSSDTLENVMARGNNAGGLLITNMADGALASDAATLGQVSGVSNALAAYLPLAGGSMLGPIDMAAQDITEVVLLSGTGVLAVITNFPRIYLAGSTNAYLHSDGTNLLWTAP